MLTTKLLLPISAFYLALPLNFFFLFTSQSVPCQPQNGPRYQNLGQLLSLPLRGVHATVTAGCVWLLIPGFVTDANQ